LRKKFRKCMNSILVVFAYFVFGSVTPLTATATLMSYIKSESACTLPTVAMTLLAYSLSGAGS
jgi:hypothetical protein